MDSQVSWQQLALWWTTLAQRHQVEDRAQLFFANGLGEGRALEKVTQEGGDPDYVLFVLLRHWIPPVLPPPGRERTAKSDPDYWLESEQILKAAVVRLRELRPVIDLLTTPNPLAQEPAPPSPVVEVELARMLEGIAEITGSYGGPDYTSIVKHFDPIPLRQTQPFKHNKRHSAELWVIFLLREHFRSIGLGKDRCWRLIADVVAAAEIVQGTDQPYQPGELKSWWTKNWPRTYTMLKEKGSRLEATHTAYQSDYEWFQVWFQWQTEQDNAQPSA
ncbi:MAG: hypothetical protein MRJ96_05200 [Nitrospirales bacterium]|nr:hypothetical protein [Nitrospira sp.]MDR4500832.1 hypothetical protein [Nitrospirales bacterium]